MSNIENKDQKPARMDVELLNDNHQHADNKCATGDVINVTKAQGEKLIAEKNAKASSKAAVATGSNA